MSANDLLDNDRAQAGERRQVTVMFCDLVNSSALAAALDPEDFRSVLRDFQRCCVDAIEAHEGYVAQYLGDGLVAYFGHPVASETAAEQAVRAARELLRLVPGLDMPGGRLTARIGVATGLAVVGDVLGSAASEQTAITGRVAILASRVQSVAAAGVVTIADETRRLVGDVFSYTDLGLRDLKGFPVPVRLWSVTGERTHESRFDAMRGWGVPFLVGRRREVKSLNQLWNAAVQGSSSAVLVSGEAGIGKSTLIRTFRGNVEGTGGAVATFQCSPRSVQTPLHPVVAYLQRAAGWLDGDTVEARTAKLRSFIGNLGLDDRWSALTALLSVADAATVQTVNADPARQKQETISLLLQLLHRFADQQPTLVVLEDAHWADPTTSDFISELLGSRCPRTLFVALARPEFRPDWAEPQAVRKITLRRLTAAQSEAVVTRVAEGRLPRASVAQIVARSDGVPLFLEEIARTALEAPRNEDGPTSGGIPMTLQDGLAARLQRLGSAKLTAQVGSVLGRTFALETLAHVLGQDTDKVARELARVQSAALVRPSGGAHRREFTFTHTLIQEAAYESLLRHTRRDLHRRSAAALLALRPDIDAVEPETLAHHYDVAEESANAARCWLHAGQRAQAKAANVEALSSFRRGLKALGSLAAPETSAVLEFQLQLGVGQSSYVLNGPAHEQTVAAYERAQALIDVITDPDQRGRTLYGIFAGYHFASKLDLAESPARLMHDLAVRHQRRGDLCQAHRMLGYVAFFRGQHEVAIGHFEELAARYREEDHGSQAYQYGADCLVGTRGFHAVIESISAPYADAVDRAESNCAFAKDLDHPASLGWAYAAACYVHYFGRNAAAAGAVSAEGMAYCEAHGVASWYAHCRLFHIWSRAVLGSERGQAQQVRDVMSAAASGNKLGLCLFRVVLAEILLLDGEAPAALEEAKTVLHEIGDSGQRFFEPAARLLYAQALHANSVGTTRVRKAFAMAASVARRSGASVIELRALRTLSVAGAASARRNALELTLGDLKD